MLQSGQRPVAGADLVVPLQLRQAFQGPQHRCPVAPRQIVPSAGPGKQGIPTEHHFVSESRRKLCLPCAKAGLEAKRELQKNEISLYVGISLSYPSAAPEVSTQAVPREVFPSTDSSVTAEAAGLPNPAGSCASPAPRLA